MKFAVIGDIHSNKYALESVLKVDNTMKTNINDIYACGDCIETFSR